MNKIYIFANKTKIKYTNKILYTLLIKVICIFLIYGLNS